MVKGKPQIYKICRTCKKKLWAPDNFYWTGKNTSDGYYTYCKKCHREKVNERHRLNRIPKKKIVKPINMKIKRCTSCGHDLPRTEFYNRTASTDGLQSKCKQCRRNEGKDYRLQNRYKLNIHQMNKYREPKRYKPIPLDHRADVIAMI